jgi:hypothetical protein
LSRPKGSTFTFSPEGLARIRAAAVLRRGLRRKPHSAETKAKLKARNGSPESVEHFRKKGIERYSNPQERAAQAERRRQYLRLPGTRLKLSEAMIKSWDRRLGVGVRNNRRPQEHLFTFEYKEWRTAVFTRDRYTCQACGKLGSSVRLEAHHLKSWHNYPELRYEISNGVTLCAQPCHKNANREQRRAEAKEFAK